MTRRDCPPEGAGSLPPSEDGRAAVKRKAMADPGARRGSARRRCPEERLHALVDHVLTGRSALPEATATRHSSGLAVWRAHAGSPTCWSSSKCFSGPMDASTPTAVRCGDCNPPREMLRADAGARPGIRRTPTDRHCGSRETRGCISVSRGHANQHQLFVERALRLADPRSGRLVVPSGIAHDHGCALLRHLLLRQSRVEFMVGFDNSPGKPSCPPQRAVSAADRPAEGETTRVRCRFGLQDPAALDALASRPRIAKAAVGSPSHRHCSSSCRGPDSPSRTCARRQSGDHRESRTGSSAARSPACWHVRSVAS